MTCQKNALNVVLNLTVRYATFATTSRSAEKETSTPNKAVNGKKMNMVFIVGSGSNSKVGCYSLFSVLRRLNFKRSV
ncbi:hypothetical protein M5W68_01360 [Paenibacillus larvae]|uniref:hypothetical protein n=1 Tax=Paenibacillus larvae TaxID=1464 RepID=UPI00227E4423|nr:hypothetical protein [Paenibacillus larvae]MCY9508470.1 hypothetical protein [Paenibacillus larvae]MCY9523824.1 hypothetical protein [Paenibacillus larvae]